MLELYFFKSNKDKSSPRVVALGYHSGHEEHRLKKEEEEGKLNSYNGSLDVPSQIVLLSSSYATFACLCPSKSA